MSVRDLLQDMKDSIKPRKLGYVSCKLSEEQERELGVPEGAVYDCYMPKDMADKVLAGEQKELDTDNFASGTIKMFQKDKPQFKGIILEPTVSKVSDYMKIMQIYANKYNVPACMRANGSYRFVVPQQTIERARRGTDHFN